MYFHYRIHGVLLLVLFFLSIFSSSSSSTSQINSNSVLVALLDSHYTELVELIEKAMLLQTLENTVATHNITIFAPNNEALERNLDSDFKQFLLEPVLLDSDQKLAMPQPTPLEATPMPDLRPFRAVHAQHHYHLPFRSQSLSTS
ncbi:unnamed protein product [Vicia faba]|uniref:FAS1 domain-containing protein n=1 Tax=Vicia faba TaxID=3906 RepID=A0AAV1B647_VICFA|nr:unnamed protein product [Vicia faba]